MLHKTSIIHDGNMSLRFSDTDTVIQNRKNFLEKHHSTWEKHICMRCNHGDAIVLVDSNTNTDEYRMVDAEVLVTQDANITLMLLTADCLPTVLHDPVTSTLALAHFSRQTIAGKLPSQLIAQLISQFQVDPKNLSIFVGPYIHTESYRFPTPLKHVSEILKPYVTVENDFSYIDLLAAHNTQLTAAGVPTGNITHSSIDTATSSEHFSHYRDTKQKTPQGRIATIAKFSNQTIVNA